MEYSLVIITKNRKKFFKKALDSVLCQTIQPKEYIILDNGSTDGTVELLLEYKKKHPNFRIFNIKDIGYTAEVNVGVKLVKTPLVLIMDDDASLIDENWMKVAIRNMRDNIGVVWGNPSGFLNNITWWESFLGSAFLTRKDLS